MKAFFVAWAIAFAALLLGGAVDLLLHPELNTGGISFNPDWKLLDLHGPARLMSHMPALFVLNAAVLSGLLALFCVRSAEPRE